ncbi:MAG TPA: DUF6146 family protein [Bacteroidales bacterium]|nr:DUF6146 family protein [Bacteroidales bacterium]HPR58438.1 DUF6146 family protein [Bacteroidales bacterium]HRW97284.1 DUF6146 family protein [Bacteroidales bacterium]
MKTIFFFFFLIIFPLAINAQTESNKSQGTATEIRPIDSTEYELIVSDAEFENWLITNSRPVWYHENDYYRFKNRLYVVNWNNRVRQAMYRPPYDYEIEYDPSVDYGVEVNWKLYWYFKYLEQKLGIDLGT